MLPNQEEIALIRSIVADPDDDTPRLVYADWLDEHGRSNRARLIRVQCTLVNLQAEERELIEKHGREWGDELFGVGADDWKFHRGFPEEVTMRLQAYLTEHERINDLTPLSHLHLLGGTDDYLRRLAELPAARQIRSLEVGTPASQPPPGEHFGVEGIRALAASPHLLGLRNLRLHSHQIGAAGADVIAGSPKFANLTHLALTDPALQGAHSSLTRVIQSHHLSRLVELQLGEMTVGSKVIGLMRSTKPSGPQGPQPG